MCIVLRNVLLTVLAHRPMTGYQIARNFDQVLSHFWQASHQQIYRELARMNRDGYVVFRAVAQFGKPEKKLYSLTRAGRAALRKWVAMPTFPPRPQNDLLVKILAGLMVNKPALEREIARVQADTGAYLKQLHSMDEQCRKQPIETSYDRALYFALRRGLLVVKAQSDWLKEVSEFLSSGEPRGKRPMESPSAVKRRSSS
jgi:DNA-binding PadR family transcriptional regulator